MAFDPLLVTAAPNQSEIKARILSMERSPHFADKWLLRLEIIAVKAISGGLFAREGQNIQAFTVQLPPDLAINQLITAEAEFLGDAAGGQLQLHNLKKVSF